MGRLIKHIVFVTFLLSQVNFVGQSNEFKDLPEEKININTNSKLFLSGENIFFTIGVFNKKTNTFSFISKMAYVFLLDSDKNIISNQKIGLKNGIGGGTIYIPTNLKTGQYKIVAYTQWMLNNDYLPYSTENIYLINPFQKNNKQVTTSEKDSVFLNKNIIKKTQIFDKNIRFFPLEFSAFKTRKEVSFELENLSGKGAFLTLSVRKVDNINLKLIPPIVEINPNKYQKTFIPELRGEIIAGKVFDKSTNVGVPNKNISLSISGNQNIFKTCKTNEKGEFYFNISEKYKSGELSLQVLDQNQDNYQITLKEFNFPFLNDIKFNEVYISPEIEDWIIEKSIQSQIENAYFQKQSDTTHNELPNFKLFGDPDKTYVLDEYTRFPTVEKTIVEVIEGVSIKKENSEKKVNIITYGEPEYYFADFENFVVVDGVPILKQEHLFQLNANRIHTISIYKGLFFHGNVIYNKLLLVNTKNSDFTLPDNELQFKEKILSPENFSSFDGPDYDKEELNRIPDFRSQLFWESNVELKNSKQKFKFFTSDLSGEFEIVIKGYWENGAPIEMVKYFKVD